MITVRTVFFAAWLSLLLGGFYKLVVYTNTSGLPATAPASYPKGSELRPQDGLSTLLIFVHPRCACSKATLGELERLVPYIKDKFKTYVVFVKPQGLADDWAKEALWKASLQIPGVDTVLDSGGVEAKKFGAVTSGQTLLYDSSGILVFKGGITPSRSHMGDSMGRDSILTFLETGRTNIKTSPVFGCSLAKPERQPAGRMSQ